MPFCLRGAARSLYVGVLVAIPSGVGVAFSILGGNVGSLVGVAISASLLPPAVNAVSILFKRKCNGRIRFPFVGIKKTF